MTSSEGRTATSPDGGRKRDIIASFTSPGRSRSVVPYCGHPSERVSTSGPCGNVFHKPCDSCGMRSVRFRKGPYLFVQFPETVPATLIDLRMILLAGKRRSTALKLRDATNFIDLPKLIKAGSGSKKQSSGSRVLKVKSCTLPASSAQSLLRKGPEPIDAAIIPFKRARYPPLHRQHSPAA